jgi:hypothetical protein
MRGKALAWVSGLENCALVRIPIADALPRNFQDLTP